MIALMSSALEALKARLFDVNALHAATSIMGWDQQCYMPPGGADARAEHLSRLERMAHVQFTDDVVGRWLEDAAKEVEGEDALYVKRAKRSYDLATKLPETFVEERSKACSQAFDVWIKARAENDFKLFLPHLEKQFDFARQEADLRGYTVSPYDALLNLYEEGATAADATAMFAAIKQPLTDLVKKTQAAAQPDDSWLYGDWPEADQRRFTEHLAKAVGYDFNRGRQDVAAHPFCTGWSCNDIRITTRFKNYLGSAVFGTLHESGHAMYEQGSPQKWDRTPLAGGVSLGIHESQSRLWENLVGRSKAFWSHFLPDLKQNFPAVQKYDIDHLYKAINRVQPSLIRVEADEVTYNLHVLIRFELEVELLTGKLAVKDLPEAWNAKYAEYLGVTPSTDSEGCLQDVHWSGGSIGYFPTYSMGTILSYQFWKRMKADIADPEALMAEGQFAPILGWLQEHIYSKGSSIAPKELVLQVTGKPLDPTDYLDGITKKYSALYGL
jgi:carboxypeptidase Taq